MTLPSARVAVADQIDIISTRDNTLYQGTTPLSNGGGTHMFAGRTGQSNLSVRRALVYFDIAGNLPPDAIIDGAELQLFVSNASQQLAQNIRLHRVTTDWGESISFGTGGQGSGAPAFVGDTTWVFAIYNTQPWDTPGGDYTVPASATTSVGAFGPYTWPSTAGVVNDVRKWLEEPFANHGWILIGNEGASQSAKRFDTREEGIASRRPRLRVFFHLPPQFVRGDCNNTGTLDVVDVTQLLHTLFPGISTPTPATCLDACDANDDGLVNVADVVTQIQLIFFSGPPPCAQDTDMDALDCLSYSHCP